MSQISPCMRVCQYNDHGYCIACRRHLWEIARWDGMSDQEARRRIRALARRAIDRPFDPADLDAPAGTSAGDP